LLNTEVLFILNYHDLIYSLIYNITKIKAYTLFIIVE